MSEQTLPTIYTLAEAAERLRMNKNALSRLARRTGHCSQAGRNLLFSEEDLLALWEEMRVPATRFPIVSPSPTTIFQRLDPKLHLVIHGPGMSVDRRLVGVLRWLSQQRLPKTFHQIERCGVKTVDELIAKELVDTCGEDTSGNTRIKINSAGREQVKKYDKWMAAKEEHRRRFI